MGDKLAGTFYVQMAAAQGARGMLPYPAGTYSSSTTYTATEQVAPYVLLDGTYYVMNKAGAWLGTSTGKTPAQDYAANGTSATWIPFESFKAIYVELLFARFGLLGSAVFYDDYMFSQHGVDASGNETSDYSGFASGAFTPNILCNFKNGEGHLACGNIRWDKYGYLYQKSRPRIMWRNIADEMDAARNWSSYPINLLKGTYLDLSKSGSDNVAILPDPASHQNAIIDTSFTMSTRSSYSIKLKCTGKLYIYDGGIKYPAYIEGTTASGSNWQYGTITSVQDKDTGAWEWFAEGCLRGVQY